MTSQMIKAVAFSVAFSVVMSVVLSARRLRSALLAVADRARLLMS